LIFRGRGLLANLLEVHDLGGSYNGKAATLSIGSKCYTRSFTLALSNVAYPGSIIATRRRTLVRRKTDSDLRFRGNRSGEN